MIINGYNLHHLTGVVENLGTLSFEAVNEDFIQYFHGSQQPMQKFLVLKLQ